jgi:hypothetical protein
MSKSRTMKFTVYIAKMEAEKNACNIFVGNPEANGPVENRHGWNNNIKRMLKNRMRRIGPF